MSPWQTGANTWSNPNRTGNMVGGGLMGAAPARSGTGPGVADINPLAANILSTLLNPGAGAALANSMAMLQNPGPSGGNLSFDFSHFIPAEKIVFLSCRTFNSFLIFLLLIGSYGAFGNQNNSSFGGNRMDSHRGGNNAERDNRVSTQFHA